MNDEHDETPLDPRLTELAQDYQRAAGAGSRCGVEGDSRRVEQSAVGSRQAVDSRQVSGRRRSRGGRMPVLSTRAAAWISGIAALLVLGIGIGRMTAPTVGRQVATAPVTRAPSMALEVAAAQHLSQSEAYLTLFRASVRDGQVDSLPVAAARELLATNRLLLDSRVADARLRPLLLDLELVLAEITQLGTSGRQADVKLITDGLDHGDVMMRLRVVPGRRSLPNGVL